MIRTLALAGAAAALLLGRPACSAGPSPPAAAWLPADAWLAVDVPQPAALIDRLFQPAVVQAVTSSPAWRAAMAEQGAQQALDLVRYFQRRFDADTPTLLKKLAGRGVTAAVGPGRSRLLVVAAEDAAALDEVHDFFLMIARNKAREQGRPDRVASTEHHGVPIWRFGPNEAHALVDGRLILGDSEETVVAALDRARSGRGSLADQARYQAARRALGDGVAAAVYADLAALRSLPRAERSFRQLANPLGVLLLAPIVEPLREAAWLAGGLTFDAQRLTLAVRCDAPPPAADQPEGFAAPAGGAGGAPGPLAAPNRIASVELYRDLRRFYAAKDELFPERTSGLIFFENMMGIFFTGRDLTEEVLGQLTPDVRLVLARQTYEPGQAAPDPQLPALAAVFRMRDPQRFAPAVEEAFQKALGLVNFTRGQQAQPGLIIDRREHAGVKYTVAAFSTPGEEAGRPLDVRFNFQPALAMTDGYVILSSTDALAQALIDAAREESRRGLVRQPGAHSRMEVDGRQLAAILAANREALIRNDMVEKGHAREQAERQLDAVLGALQFVRRVVATAEGGPQGSELRIELEAAAP